MRRQIAGVVILMIAALGTEARGQASPPATDAEARQRFFDECTPLTQAGKWDELLPKLNNCEPGVFADHRYWLLRAQAFYGKGWLAPGDMERLVLDARLNAENASEEVRKQVNAVMVPARFAARRHSANIILRDTHVQPPAADGRRDAPAEPAPQPTADAAPSGGELKVGSKADDPKDR